MSKETLVPLSEAKIKLHELVRDLPERDVLLLRHGRPVGFMTSYSGWQALLDRLEDLEDRLAVQESREESPDARTSWEAVKAETNL